MKPLCKYIDHTVLKPEATPAAIEKICAEALENNFAAVCINPCHIELAKRLLAGSEVKVATVIGFPLGANTTAAKAFEARDAIARGADELDMVLNIGMLKAGAYDYVREDIHAVVEASGGKTVKVIFENCLLTEAEKIAATQLSCEAGANYVKTSTGFNKSGATVEDVSLMKSHCTDGVKVKAAGGIRSYEDALKMIEAGAERLGTSAGAAIIAGAK